MQQPEVSTGTRDTTYNLISVLYHALQGAENYIIYARDAEMEGGETAKFFRDIAQEESRRADRAKELLKKQLSKE